MPTCPLCSGSGKNWCFWDSQHGSGTAEILCFTCNGEGSITDEHAARMEAGKKMRDERIASGKTLHVAAKELGITPAQLSARENGR